ncbi:type I methionyl aminopeptidase [Calditerrivibrio nitroreducens]|uniref:Methionine aminopeptidase n=1 Tax=Calditerrivibrio nitroreducens (strain DSM 19672 / NBRC 101217 / Yu37-1) TaxID=768670 RepID=E4TEN7_CALNY|nr:type I methionyl aminopeptidase [Calditerrivibrio nitroreducens]ADR19394.1 methionine aminopeptidase, type I [Calditerrivibrio nitroreducens DSM 19672]
MVEIKSKSEIEKIKAACEVVKEALEKVSSKVKPGVTTKTLDNFIENIIKSRSAIPSFKGYRGYPSATCISINEVVVHGIPSDNVLKEGDIVSIDVGAYKDGFHGDACRTFCVGDVSEEKKKLVEVTEQSFFEGMKYADERYRLHDISHAIQSYVESNGFNVIRDYFGHGIGRQLHEEPTIPNFGKPNRGVRLRAGMVLAIEPMVVIGDWKVEVLEDGWTVITADGKDAAHYENTVVITNNGPEILTL